MTKRSKARPPAPSHFEMGEAEGEAMILEMTPPSPEPAEALDPVVEPATPEIGRSGYRNLVFTTDANAMASGVAILRLYQMLLGRDPENSYVIEEAKSQPIWALVEAFVESEEFQINVVQPFNQDGPFRHELAAPAPPVEQRAWLASLLVLPDADRDALISAPTWRSFFDSWLQIVGPSIPADTTPPGPPILPDQVVMLGDTLVKVEAYHAGGLRGWLVHTGVAKQDFHIECFVGETSAGWLIPSIYRPDLHAVFGRDGMFGFDIAFGHRTEASRQAGAPIRLVDVGTGQSVLPPAPFDSTSSQGEEIARARLRLTTLAYEVSELTRTLNALLADRPVTA